MTRVSKLKIKKNQTSFLLARKVFKHGSMPPYLKLIAFYENRTRLLLTSRTCKCCIMRNCLFLYEVKRSRLFYSKRVLAQRESRLFDNLFFHERLDNYD